MTKRKKKLLFIQIIIFTLATLLIFFTYYKKDLNNENNAYNPLKEEKVSSANKDVAKDEKKLNYNSFENVKYFGIDLNDNRYKIKSKYAEFEINKPELIDMKVMDAVFYFKDGTILNVTGDFGTYNNKTKDMTFRQNVKATYMDHLLYSDNLDYFNTKNILTIYGNVITESVQGELKADILNFDLNTKTLDVSMYNNGQVNVNLRGQ